MTDKNNPARQDSTQPRYQLWDSTRGVAILLMVVFHFCYDLRYFGLVDWNVPNGPGWWQFRYVILTLFIGTAGVSFGLAHSVQGYRWKSFLRRQLLLGASALAITLGSLFMFPLAWIYFGILHFLFLAGFLCLPLVGRPNTSLVLGLAILVLYAQGLLSPVWPFAYIEGYLPRYTEDFVPLAPWLGVCYLGLAAGHYGQFIRSKFGDPGLPLLTLAGRHSLAIYLLHQPLLFALIWAFLQLGNAS